MDMGLRRHITPEALTLVFLLLAREIYPYATPTNDVLVEGFEIVKVAEDIGGPTCLERADNNSLLICDRDGDRIFSNRIHKFFGHFLNHDSSTFNKNATL